MEGSSTFSLFLTNIDYSVTEQQVASMVEQSLAINRTLNMEIIKLTPKWSRSSTQYTSFKIVLDKGLKRKALQSETWPIGVLYREFIERPRRTWKPITS